MNERIRTFRNGMALLLAAVLIAGCSEKPESLVASAKANLAKNDRSAAVIQLRNALQKNPDLAEARFLLGKSLLESGDLLGAEKELRKAAELSYPSDEVVPALARVLVRRGDHKKALEEFGGVTIAAPAQKADLQTTIGQAQMALGNVDAARTAFAAALTAQPDYPLALLGEARLKAAGGDIPGALAVVEGTLAKSPALVEAWQLKGDLLTAQGQVEPALAAFRKAVESKPDYLAAHYMIVTLLMQQGKTEESGKAFAAMKKVAPTNPQTLYLQALLAFRDKDYVAARGAIQQHLRSAPGNLMGVLLGAQIDYQLGSYAQAEAALAAVLKSAPKHGFARRLMVRTNLRQGRPGKALEALQPLLQDAKPDSDTLALAGDVYAQNGDTTTAARYFEQAAALDPTSTSKRAVVALAHLAQGDSERGLAELQAAAREDTGVRADLALVSVNLRQRKFDAALAAVSAIEKKQPDKPLPHNLRGTVLLAKGDIAGARASFDRALAMDPKFFPAVANLARLDLLDRKPDDAKKRFEAVLANDPKNVQALLAIAALREQAGGSPDEIAGLIAKAVAASTTDPAPRLTLIAYYLRKNDPKKAVAAAQDAIAAIPDQPAIVEATGQAYRAAGDSNQAIANFAKLAKLRPDSPTPFLRMAEVQVADKDYTAARESAQKALALKPDSVEAHRILVTLELDAGKAPAALATAREMQKQRPKESIGYLLEGDIRARQKSWGEAAAAYRNGIKSVGTTDLAIRLDLVLQLAGNSAEAEKFSSGWLKDHPKDLLFRHFRSQQAAARKDYASAASQYRAIVEIQPNDVRALNNLAWALGQLKDPKSLEYAQRAYDLAPDNPAVLDTLGVLLLEKGDAVRGAEVLQKAVLIAPNDPRIRLNLARTLIKAGKKDTARKELETLAKLGDKFPGQPEVATLMQGL